jgi:type II secretory pathway pseudopilin PulG
MRAFTLIETIIYIALFGLFMSGVLLSVYGMLQSGDQFSNRTSASNEGAFVTAKLDWALRSLGSVTTPSSGYGTSLSVIRSDGTQVDMRLTGGVIEMRINGGSYIALTSSNVTVSSLGFNTFSGTQPGIEASTTINGLSFMTRRYLRK